MSGSRSRNVFVGVIAGIAVSVATGMLMGQGASQPVRSESQYFVTSDGDRAHLWVREGTTLRVVGHAECTKCPWDAEKNEQGHKDGDGHDHGKAAPKK